MIMNRSRQTLMITAVGLALGASCGVAIGYVLAAAKMLGDAEVFPANALPPAPNVVTWMVIGVGVGAISGIVSGGVIARFTLRELPPVERTKRKPNKD